MKYRWENSPGANHWWYVHVDSGEIVARVYTGDWPVRWFWSSGRSYVDERSAKEAVEKYFHGVSDT